MFLGQSWPFSETGIEGLIWIRRRRKERWGESVRHDRWRLFGIRCIFPQGSMILSLHPEPVYSGFWHQPIFLHRNRYLCIFDKHGGHLSTAAHRWDRLPLSLACLAQETRWPAKRCAKPATDRTQLDLNPFNSCHCLLHTNRKWLAPSKVLIPIWIMWWLFHLRWMVWRISWPTLTNQSVAVRMWIWSNGSNDTLRSTGVW